MVLYIQIFTKLVAGDFTADLILIKSCFSWSIDFPGYTTSVQGPQCQTVGCPRCAVTAICVRQGEAAISAHFLHVSAAAKMMTSREATMLGGSITNTQVSKHFIYLTTQQISENDQSMHDKRTTNAISLCLSPVSYWPQFETCQCLLFTV